MEEIFKQFVESDKKFKTRNEAKAYLQQVEEDIIGKADEYFRWCSRNIDKAAFDCIVKERNWKFKEFKAYKKGNRYQWRELYEKIDYCKGYDLLSYISQYAH